MSPETLDAVRLHFASGPLLRTVIHPMVRTLDVAVTRKLVR